MKKKRSKIEIEIRAKIGKELRDRIKKKQKNKPIVT